MVQEERLNYLINELCNESKQYEHIRSITEEKRKVLRLLMNIRMPDQAPEEFLRIQDEFLEQEAIEKGIVLRHEIPTIREQFGSTCRHADKISIWQGDITRLKVDGIVNAANSQMLGCFVPCHGCIDNAIHSVAGVQLRNECSSIMKKQGHEEPTGQAKITGGYNLPAKHVLHTVGPIIRGKLTKKDCLLLESCYSTCLLLAEETGLKDIAFCCISTGEFHFPNRKAAEIAIDAVRQHLDRSDKLERVIFNVFKNDDYDIYRNLLK